MNSTKKKLLADLYKQLHRLLNIQEILDSTIKEEDNMALDQSVQDVLTAVDTATSAIAARISRLVAANSGALSAEAKAAFQVEIDKLNELGKDPVIPGGGV